VLGRFQTLTIYEQKIVRFFDITLNLNWEDMVYEKYCYYSMI
jgi:hypothetical protein